MLQESCTCYIGNLSFYTTETQLWAAFSRFGPVERIVMGLDRHRRTPCGFAFVIYAQKEGADLAVSWLNGTTLDERPIRVDKDHGFREGRQFGRGRSGGQVRDEHRVLTRRRTFQELQQRAEARGAVKIGWPATEISIYSVYINLIY